MKSIQATFVEHAGALKFTHEWLGNQPLQLLDLKITFHDESVCWMYAPCTQKSLLRFDSAHTKLIKRGTVAREELLPGGSEEVLRLYSRREH